MSGKNSKRRKKDREDEEKTALKNRITEALELPKEIVLNVSKLTLIGNSDLIIENYKGIMEYDNGRIRVNTGAGVIKITGSRLLIKEITSEDILIYGEIDSLEFLK
jgi:sporulation protein YqfC